MEEKDLVFLCPVYSCKVCGTENFYTVIINEHGLVSYGGSVCLHEKNNRVGQIINPKDARVFLEVEKMDTEQYMIKATGKKRKQLAEYIANADNALERLRKPCVQQRGIA